MLVHHISDSNHSFRVEVGEFDPDRFEQGWFEFGMTAELWVDPDSSEPVRISMGSIMAHTAEVAAKRLAAYDACIKLAGICEVMLLNETALVDIVACLDEHLKGKRLEDAQKALTNA